MLEIIQNRPRVLLLILTRRTIREQKSRRISCRNNLLEKMQYNRRWGRQIMSSDKQLQKAGDGATQLQANTVNIYNGVSEERVRSIIQEQYCLARQEYTEDAYRIANERVKQFEESMMSRIMQVENALPSFADPAFQFLLRHALQTAACTERPVDYDLLTELLVCHVQKGENRKNRTGINRAVEIVGEIDNDALCALTVAHALSFFVPVSGNCGEGLKITYNIFRTFEK